MFHSLQFLVFTMAGWLNRRQQHLIDYLREENRILREQLGSRRLRLTDEQRRRLAVWGKVLGRKALGEVAGIVTPDTILRWYRRLIAKKYDGSAHRGRGRPTTPKQIAELVVRMAEENPGWGYTRIRGALANLGHQIARNTVKRILQDHGIEPAPERGQRTPWKTFLEVHWDWIAAADLFTVEVLSLGGLRRYFVLFVIELKTRRVKIAGIHSQPYGEWMEQMARNLTDGLDGFLHGTRHLIHDRDPLYTKAFGEILRDSGVETIRLPARSPNLNAYAERFVRSIKEECLSRVVFLGDQHLRFVVQQYVEHYHHERNHQGTAAGGAARSRSTPTPPSIPSVFSAWARTFTSGAPIGTTPTTTPSRREITQAARPRVGDALHAAAPGVTRSRSAAAPRAPRFPRTCATAITASGWRATHASQRAAADPDGAFVRWTVTGTERQAIQ